MIRRRDWMGGLMAMAAHPAAEADFSGFVTRIETGNTSREGQITVESHANKEVRRYRVKITASTELVRREGQTERGANLSELRVKDWVKIWFAGAAPKSDHSQATAQRIVIVDRL